MRFEVKSCGPLDTNTIVVRHKGTVLIFDPACKELASFSLIGGRLYVLLTHGHWDHIQALSIVPTDVVYVHKEDAPMLKDPYLNGSLRGLMLPITVSIKTVYVREGLLRLGDITMQVIHTPGHTPGSLSFYFPQDGKAIVGDFLFPGTIGRTDLPGGSSQSMRASIRKFFSMVESSTLIYPGHGRPFILRSHPLYKKR